MPMLILSVSSYRSLTIGIPEYGYSWRRAREHAPPGYIVSGADWLLLVKSFGLDEHRR